MWYFSGTLRSPPPTPDAVHPIDEADVYLAHGMPWAAIACLRLAAGGVGTLAEADWAMPLDKRQLLQRIADIEIQNPTWREMQHAHERHLVISRLKRVALAAFGVAAVALAAKLIPI